MLVRGGGCLGGEVGYGATQRMLKVLLAGRVLRNWQKTIEKSSLTLVKKEYIFLIFSTVQYNVQYMIPTNSELG